MTATVTIHAAGNAVKVQLFDEGTDGDAPSDVQTVEPGNVGTFHVHQTRSLAISEEPAAAQGDDSADGEA